MKGTAVGSRGSKLRWQGEMGGNATTALAQGTLSGKGPL